MTKYTVCGPHGVHEVKPGGEIELDPEEPGTQRLLSRGQIAIASTKDPLSSRGKSNESEG